MDLHGATAEHPLSGLTWRAMTVADLDGVVLVARVAFPDHFEDRDCFENRLALHPEACFVLEGEGAIQGYLVAYPWLYGSAPALNTRIDALPETPELIYLHDLALSPALRGRKAAGPVIRRLVEQARAAGFDRIALVAVNDAAPFWERHGFTVEQASGMAEKLASYGPDARYMIRRLD